MHILHITTFLQGGAGRIITELACSQAASGHLVTVVTTQTGEKDYANYNEWVERLNSSGIRLVFVDSTFKRDIALNVAALDWICKTVDCSSVSLIHTHAAIPSLVALLVRGCVKKAIPIVQTMHGWGIRKTREQVATDIALMNQLDCVATVSVSSRRLLIDFGVTPGRIEVVPNGVDLTVPPETSSRIDLLKEWRSTNYKILVCIGTVGPRKNQRLLVEAMAEHEAPGELACAIVGEGEEASSLESFAREHGICDRIHFFGYQPKASDFIACADWLILPSQDEGMPISVLEAYSAAVPVIGSDIPELAEIILPDRTGFIFSSGDASSLLRVLATVAHLPESRRRFMGTEARKLWEKEYSLSKMLTRYQQIYQDLT